MIVDSLYTFDLLNGVDKTVTYRAFFNRTKSYSPYSNYKVGAVVVCNNDTVYDGTNIENMSFGLTICAERLALFKAIQAGEHKETIDKIIFATDTPEEHFSPCGACLQTIAEFCDPLILIAHYNGMTIRTWSLSDLLPHSSAQSSIQKACHK